MEVLRSTVFWRKWFLNDWGSLTRNRLKYIEVLRYTVFWRNWFLADGGGLLNPQIVGNRGIKAYRFLAKVVSE